MKTHCIVLSRIRTRSLAVNPIYAVNTSSYIGRIAVLAGAPILFLSFSRLIKSALYKIVNSPKTTLLSVLSHRHQKPLDAVIDRLMGAETLSRNLSRSFFIIENFINHTTWKQLGGSLGIFQTLY